MESLLSIPFQEKCEQIDRLATARTIVKIMYDEKWLNQ